MIQKNTEQLILDFSDRFGENNISISIERRLIDKSANTYVLWFIANSTIWNTTGESYTLDKAIGELTRNVMKITKPNNSNRRILIENHPYEGMENIVEYRETK